MTAYSYDSYRYIFPPRPENPSSPATLPNYDDGRSYLAQPKLNGDCMEVYTNGKEVILKNRHNESFSKDIKLEKELIKLHRQTLPGEVGKWMVLVGEYMVKSKKDKSGKPWNHKFVIFDIIVFDGVQLIGKTFEEREKLLDKLYGKNDLEVSETGVNQLDFLYTTNVPDCYRIKTYRNCFSKLWADLVKIDMYEGLVLKRAKAKLENGLSEQNNHKSQVKFRKSTKNYSF